MQITTGNNLKLLMIKWKLKPASVKPEQNRNPVWGDVYEWLPCSDYSKKIMEYRSLKSCSQTWRKRYYTVSLLITNSAFNISSSSGTQFIMYKYWTARESNYKFIDFLEQKKIIYKLKLFIIGISWQLPLLLIALVWYLLMSGTEDVYSRHEEVCLH